jgi:hypothetical protein
MFSPLNSATALGFHIAPTGRNFLLALLPYLPIGGAAFNALLFLHLDMFWVVSGKREELNRLESC